MKQLSKEVKVSILKGVIERIKECQGDYMSNGFGLCFLIQKEYDKYEMWANAYSLNKYMRFKELSDSINRALMVNGYSSYINHYKDWWSGRLALIRRVLKKVEKL